MVDGEHRPGHASTHINEIRARPLHAGSANGHGNRALHAGIGWITRSISPIVLARACLARACVDWLMHISLSPGKQAQLVDKATQGAAAGDLRRPRRRRPASRRRPPASSRCRRTTVSTTRRGGGRRST
jgi:hypothetical protein